MNARPDDDDDLSFGWVDAALACLMILAFAVVLVTVLRWCFDR